MLREFIGEGTVLSLLYQFMKRTIYKGGEYKSINKGICRGSPLSPLLGALYLEELDRAMAKSSCFYVRFMDDWVLLAKNKWAFRRIIKKVNSILNKLKLQKAVDKTFIGKIERGFDFLGFHFGNDELSVAKKSIQKLAENIVLRLAESVSGSSGKITPGRSEHKRQASGAYRVKQYRENITKGGNPMPEAVSMYVKRWISWVKSIYGKEINMVDTDFNCAGA